MTDLSADTRLGFEMPIAADYQAATSLGALKFANLTEMDRFILYFRTSVYNILADHIADHIKSARTLKSYQSGCILRLYVGSDSIILGGGPINTTETGTLSQNMYVTGAILENDILIPNPPKDFDTDAAQPDAAEVRHL